MGQGVTYVKQKSEERAKARREYIAEREAEEAEQEQKRELFIAGGENDKTVVTAQKKKHRGKGNGIDIPLDENARKDNKTRLNSKLEVECDYTAEADNRQNEEQAEPDLQEEDNQAVSDDLMNIISRASKSYDEKNKGKASKSDKENVFQYPNEPSEEELSRFEEELENAGYSPVDIKEDEEKPEHSYSFPPIQLLTLADNKNDKNAMAEMQNNATKLIETLDSFNVKASIVNMCRGPSVTRYELAPAPGVKISKITNLSDDIALNLAANGVRIEAPIPGKAAVGIEVPNKVVSMVTMRELIDSDEFRNGKSKLTCVLGKDISGAIVVTDLAKMPHLLIAGTTGSGKSVCVGTFRYVPPESH